MKKFFLIWAVLVLAAPAMAVDDVIDVCAVPIGGDAVEIRYAVVTGNLPRAFALDITVTAGTIRDVDSFFTGESGQVSQGYGIFPASFNREIDADDPNWGEPNYTPVADACDLPGDTEGGIGTSGVTIEMGSLYVDDNSPPNSGVLCVVYVTEDCNVDLALNVGRGKVVMEDGNEPNEVRLFSGKPDLQFDWGDAPDVPYPTLAINNGARHLIKALKMGANIDQEINGQPNADATGDDIAGATPDDEDGVTNLVATPEGGSVTVTVSGNCKLDAWIDFNDNGDWFDPGEQVFTSVFLNAGATVLQFAVPAYAVLETDLYSRWRVSTAGALSPEGPAINGEVEDYNEPEIVCIVPDVVDMTQANATTAINNAGFTVGAVTNECDFTIVAGNVISQNPTDGGNVQPCGSAVDIVVSLGPCDYGDADDAPYPTLLASNGARHVDTGVMLGASRDTEADGQPTAACDGDDILTSDDEDGVTFGVVTMAGGVVNVTASASCKLNAWIDWNNDGDWDDAGEQVFTDQSLNAGNNPLAITPSGATVKDISLVSRWRVNDAGGLNYTGLATDGEVEDHTLNVVCIVPNVVLQDEATACANIVTAGFVCNTIYAYHDTVPILDVISQDPTNGGNVQPCGSTVTITVSMGPCVVPNVVTMTEANAEIAIVASGFTVGDKTYQFHDTAPITTVISQDPTNGGNIEPCGDPVDLVISLGPCIVPDVVGDTNAAAQTAITDAGFSVSVTGDCSDTVAVGLVISQDPTNGGNVQPCGSTVNIVVSTGMCYCWNIYECPGQPLGDATCDGTVNAVDLFRLKQSWLKKFGEVGYNCCANFNHDSFGVNAVDLFKLKQNWLSSGLGGSLTIACPPTEPWP